MQSLFSGQQLGLDPGKLKVVHARFQESRPFSFELFEGFTSLRVLTYSVSIPMTVKMLNLFESVECVFGYEGILHDFGTILACQKELSQNVLMAVKGLDDERQILLLERMAAGHARFYVVKDSVAHSKIYLLEGNGRRRGEHYPFLTGLSSRYGNHWGGGCLSRRLPDWIGHFPLW